MSSVFGEVRQVGFITRNMNDTLKFFVETCRIGPWFVKKRHLQGIVYRGKRQDLSFSAAISYSGALQFEVIEPTSGESSIWKEWLDKYPDQLMIQHISSWPQDYHATYDAAIERGYEVVLSGDFEAGSFAYFQHPLQPDFTFEISEMTAERNASLEPIEDAVRNWDGAEPIRER
jgi:hypothetical protein